MALQFNGETNILEYIQNNVQAINDYHQDAFAWGKERLLNEFQGNDICNTLEMIPERLDRDAVVKCYEQDLYDGFIATLLWGGLEKGMTRGYFNNIANADCNKIYSKIENANNLFDNKPLRESFQSFCNNQPNKIKGIGISYFTKILYFFGKAKNSNPIPLIFDDNMIKFFFAVLMGENQQEYQRVNDSYYSTRQYRNNMEACWNFYDEYSKKMLEISTIYGITSPEQLEASMFGWLIHDRNDMSNPRNVINHFINNA